MPPNKSVKIAESQQLDILFEKDIWEASEVGLQARKHRGDKKSDKTGPGNCRKK